MRACRNRSWTISWPFSTNLLDLGHPLQVSTIQDKQMSKKDIEDIYSLSPLQQGMLFHTISTENSKLYFEQVNCTLQGKLDVSNLKRAWDKVAERHAVLRTSFAWEKIKKPVQIVHRH